MSAVDPQLLSLSKELAELGGSSNVKLSTISVHIRGIYSKESPADQKADFISFLEENNQIIIRHPSSANDLRCYEISNFFGPAVPNERVCADLVRRATSSLFDGFNANLIAYGASKTSKSTLLFGASRFNLQFDSIEGLLGALCADLLSKMDQNADKMSLSLSLWEIGMEKAVDLLRSEKQREIQSPSDITSVTVSKWGQIASVWDIARNNSSNWRSMPTGYELLPNESSLFVRIKLFNQTLHRVSTFNLIDLVGCPHLTRSLRPHISRERVEQNKAKNVSLFSLNKLLHHLCTVHVQRNEHQTAHRAKRNPVENVIAESLLNHFIGPMLTENAETMFLGAVSCSAEDYQPSLRTIQVLSRTLSIKVPVMRTPWSQPRGSGPSMVSFQHFMAEWQSVLHRHAVIESNVQEQMARIEPTSDRQRMENDKEAVDENADSSNVPHRDGRRSPDRDRRRQEVSDLPVVADSDAVELCQSPIAPMDITQDIDAFNLSLDGHELSTQALDGQLQSLRLHIPQNAARGVAPSGRSMESRPENASSHDIKNEISSLLDDILEPKQVPPPPRSTKPRAENEDGDFLKSKDLEELIAMTDTPKYADFSLGQHRDAAEKQLAAERLEREQEDHTAAHLEFANLRLQNCKLTEEVRKLKAQSKYSSLFADYDREIETLRKMNEAMASDQKLCLAKNLQLKHELNNFKLSGQRAGELKTVRILQRSLRETTKKLQEKERALTKLTSSIRHTDIRNRVLQTSKDEWCEMSELLSRRESELGASYLAQAETQAVVERLQLQLTEMTHDNHSLRGQTESLENEVATLRQLCKRINDDMKHKNQMQRVSKKWAPKRR